MRVRRLDTLSLSLVLLAAGAPAARAQRPQDARGGAAPHADGCAAAGRPGHRPARRGRARLAGGLAARQAARCDACFFEGEFVVVSVGAGAVVGGLGGLVASQVARVNARRHRADAAAAP